MIESQAWWQGSVIATDVIPALEYCSADFWIVASQPCNLYGKDFQQIPWVELVGATQIAVSDSSKSKGDHPRILHVNAEGTTGTICLQIDITLRKWVQRSFLAGISPMYALPTRNNENGNISSNEMFSGWLARSYTRVALPDEFNKGLRDCKIDKFLNEKLAKYSNKLYGIYFSIDCEAENAKELPIGKLPPPYLLGIVIAVYEDVDPTEIEQLFTTSLFKKNIPDPYNNGKNISRADNARRHGIRLIEEDINIRSIADLTVSELHGLVRYSIVDYLSDSSFAAPH